MQANNHMTSVLQHGISSGGGVGMCNGKKCGAGSCGEDDMGIGR